MFPYLFSLLALALSLPVFAGDCVSSPRALYLTESQSLEYRLERTQLGKNAQGVPSYILKDSNPSYAEIINAPSKYLGEMYYWQQYLPDHLTNSGITNIMAIASSFSKEAVDYYFLGNGMYVPYLVMSELKRFLPEGTRIFYLPFSTPLAQKLNKAPEDFTKLFDELPIMDIQKRKAVVVDSVTKANKPNQHSLIEFTLGFKKHLESRGLSKTNIDQNVIPLGLLEGAKSSHDYLTADYQEYQAALGRKAHPYLLSPVNFFARPFWLYYDRKAYNYWNGKYNSLDKDGNVKGEFTASDRLDPKNKIPVSVFEERLRLALEYQSVIQFTREWAENNAEKIANSVDGSLAPAPDSRPSWAQGF